MANKNKFIVHDGEAMNNLLEGAETTGEKIGRIIGAFILVGIILLILSALGSGS